MTPAYSFFGREQEWQQLLDFVEQPKAALTFVRGRRRVGKSSLLLKLKQESQDCFYFMGREDASDLETRRDFAELWTGFAEDGLLREISDSRLSWRRIFQEISALLRKRQKTIIVIDEIQWLSSNGSGFISLIKEFWLEWKTISQVKIIICGSSNKFFTQYVEGSEKVLRGLKTNASIWVPEFTLSEVRRYYLKTWHIQEVCLAYMMLGGVPYYLETLDPELGFVHAVNNALFTRDSIFLEEIDEVLNLEFNRQGVRTARLIMQAVGMTGSTASSIVAKTKLPEGTVYEALEKLITYGLLVIKNNKARQAQGNQRGAVYVIKDFYLNTYFSLIDPIKELIKSNKDQLLLSTKILQSKSGYYIPNFSGRAFELLVERLLEFRNPLGNLHKLLLLKSPQYEISSYSASEQQIDLIVEAPEDRLARIIECKWSADGQAVGELIKQAQKKSYPSPERYKIKHFLLAGWDVTPKQKEKAKEARVKLVGIGELL